jgi:hypothetical protein
MDICSPHCKTPLCYTRVSKRNEGYCMFCFIHTFPDRAIVKNYKTRESATVKHIMTEFPSFTWRHDKRVVNGCSARRPDLLLDLGYQVVIVEIDEDQHRNYRGVPKLKILASNAGSIVTQIFRPNIGWV